MPVWSCLSPVKKRDWKLIFRSQQVRTVLTRSLPYVTISKTTGHATYVQKLELTHVTYVTSLWTAVSCQDIRMVQLCAKHSWTLLDNTTMTSSHRPQCQLLTSWTYPSSTATAQVRGVPAPEPWCPHCAATRQVLRWTAPVARQHLWQKRKCITGHDWTSWKSRGTPLRCN